MRLKNRSTRLRWRYTHPEKGKLGLRLERDGMLAQAFLRAAASRIALLSYRRRAIKPPSQLKS